MLSTGLLATEVEIAGPATGLVWALSMLQAPLVMPVPLASGLATRTTTCTDPEPAGARLPSVQRTLPLDSVPPAVADTKVVLAGTAAVIVVALAALVPALA